MSAYLTYGFWIPCSPDDPVPAGVDSRIWRENSPKRALEVAISAAGTPRPSLYTIVEAWKDYKLARVYVGWALETYESETYLTGNGPGPVPFHARLRELYNRFGGQEYGWHLFSSDQEDP